MRQIHLWLIGFLVVLLGGYYLIYQKSVGAEIWIAAAPEKVFSYLSSDSLGSEWSVYFDHFRSLSGSPGEVGSLRRCYRAADELGIYWDEEVVHVDAPKSRELLAYNFNGLGDHLEDQKFWVLQEYSAVNGGTLLRFETGLVKRSIVTVLSMREESKEAKEVFEMNLANIKAAVENGPDYQRVYPYMQPN